MSKEKKIRKLLGREETEKERLKKWAQEVEVEPRTDIPIEIYPPSRKKGKIIKVVFGNVVAASIIGLTIFTTLKLMPNGTIQTGNLEYSSTNGNGNYGERYCDATQYEKIATVMTLKEYAGQIEKPLLYFDWYNATDYLLDSIYQLKDSKEIICFLEEMVDVNTGYQVCLLVTDDKTQMDILDVTGKEIQETRIKAIEVQLHFENRQQSAYFKYQGYRYCLQLIDPMDENTIIEYLELLIP